MKVIIEINGAEKQIEQLINQVRGVIASRVVRVGKEIVEIHVLTDTSRGPKQLVRDIESTILVKLGQQIDYKRISIAQLGKEQKQLMEGSRLMLLENNFASSRNKLTVTITVGLGNEKFKASMSGANITKNRLILTPKATLIAVEKCYGLSSLLEVNQVERVALSGFEAILVAVSLIIEQQEEILLGTALVKENVQEAAAKATLDAINRRLLIIDHIKN